ncbi:MAG: aspartyl protease family protein [Phycisphaerales bacterium]|nr:aspartyl protease family protein [Phycisphaerales bacterium]
MCAPSGLTGLIPNAAPARVLLPNGDAEVSVSIANDQIFGNVYVNGEGPYVFILDTGASQVSVSPRVAALFPGSISGTTTVTTDPTLDGTNAPLIHIDRLSFGSISFEDFVAFVFDVDPTFTSTEITFTVDGVIALPLFQQVALTLNYPESKVRVQTGVLPEVDGCSVLPLYRSSTGLVEVPATINSRSQNLLIDSGSTTMLNVPASFSDLPFIEPPRMDRIITITGTVDVLVGCVPSGTASLGCVQFADPCLVVGGELALIGGEAMLPYVVTIDQTSGRIRFQQP